jgi:hypothetical protein
MKLSDLVDYKNLIDEFSLTDIHYQARHRLDSVVHEIVNQPLQFNNFSDRVIADGHSIDRAFSQFADTVGNIRNHIENLIQELHSEYLLESTRLYQDDMCYETNEYILMVVPCNTVYEMIFHQKSKSLPYWLQYCQ